MENKNICTIKDSSWTSCMDNLFKKNFHNYKEHSNSSGKGVTFIEISNFLSDLSTAWLDKEIINIQLQRLGDYYRNFKFCDVLISKNGIVKHENYTTLCCYNAEDFVKIKSSDTIYNVTYRTSSHTNGVHKPKSMYRDVNISLLHTGSNKAYDLTLRHYYKYEY